MADTKKNKNSLLTAEQRVACEKLTGAEAPHGQRATALLALDEGATQAQAAERAGLTNGQVRYWSDKFREKGLAIFPEETIIAEEPAVAEGRAEEVAAPVEESSSAVEEEAALEPAALEPAAEKPAAEKPEAVEPAATAAEKPSKKKKKGKGSAKKKSGTKKKKAGKKGKKKSAKGGKKKAGKKKGNKKGKKKSK